MDGVNKDIQGSSKLTSQLVKTSQAASDSEWVLTLPKIPFGLSISPKEFHVLENAYYDMKVRDFQCDTWQSHESG